MKTSCPVERRTRVKTVSTGPLITEALPVGIGLGTERSVGLELGVGILGQISHHGLLVDVRVDHLLRFHQL